MDLDGTSMATPRVMPRLRRYQEHRYQTLFYTLLFTMVAMPIATFFRWGATAIELMFGATLLAAVMPLGPKRSRRFLFVLAAVLLLARPVASEAHLIGVSEVALGLWAIIGLIAAAGALRFVLNAADIEAEHVYAALSAYLLAGIFFGVTYWAIEVRWPGSFTGPSPFTRESAVYFSFVTLATRGHRDLLSQ